MDFSLTRAASAVLRWRRVAVAGAAAAAGLLLLAGGQGDALDRQLRILRDGIRSHSASGQIHIVEIDAKSINRFKNWPWPRGTHAAAIDRLRESGARLVAFDSDFSSESSPAEDEKLAAALKRADGSVILPAIRQLEGSGSSEYIDSIPAKPFENQAFLAAVNVVPDRDGYVRSMLLGLDIKGTPRPSLAAMVAEGGAQIGREFEIDYAIEPNSIPRHSFVDLVEGRVPRSALAGKRIIVGATAVELGDRYAVPRHGVIPGVVIQALAAETLLAGKVPISGAPLWPLAAALLIIGAAVRIRRRSLRVAMLAAGTASVFALPLATESWFAVSMPVAPALAAMVVAILVSILALAGERYLADAFTDPATGLPNLAALEEAAARRARANIVVVRIDRFVNIASGIGPAATANLVRRIAERLHLADDGRQIYRADASSLAWIDSPGDEDSLEHRLDAIALLMRSPVECGRLIDVSLNFGLASGKGSQVRQLVADAGAAAVNAAQRGERWRRFIDADGAEIDWQLSLLGELDVAMAAGQLWNAYQPKLDLKTGEIVGVEALVRWLHPKRGPIGPDSFIPVIEGAGRIRDLTAHVLEQGLEDALAWSESGHEIGVAVNVSATLLADHEFIETVGSILQGHGLPNGRVTIEVTETAAMDSPERAIAALESWRSLGVNISIDDYGTGQSSLNYLQKLPATELKIDKSFVQSIVTDNRNAIMVRSTIALAHELGMRTVAEGIEDEACLDLLGQMGCDTGQGYFIGKPMSAADLAAFLVDREGAQGELAAA